MLGTVKTFDQKQGFGFISVENEPDVFVHFGAIEGQSDKNLEPGQTVELVVVVGRKGPQAAHVRVIHDEDQFSGDEN
ncbi:cold-shock protein [Paucilactobacillus sp. N302-9]